MKKVLTIGGATRDIFIAHEQPQMIHLCLQEGKRSFLIYEAGKKIEVSNLAYHTGGGATNSAAAFKQLGFDVSIFCKIGTDQEGDYVIKSLLDRGIDIQFLVRDSAEPTASSFIIPTDSGDRVALVYRGANLKISEAELPKELFNGVDQLYITSLCGESSPLLLSIVKKAKKQKVNIAVNPGTSQLISGADVLRESLPYIDILILNNIEAHQCMASMIQAERPMQLRMVALLGEQKIENNMPQLLRAPKMHDGICFDLPFFFREVMARGPKIVVVTNGKEGVYVASGDNIFFHPSISASVICSLGAGDAFGSTFVGWLLQGHTVETALRAGLINSASVIGHVGAKTGLLSFAELKKRLQEIDLSLLETFPLK
jgi:sugar/nucleoside kinase (ribokinase family)